MTKTVEEAIDAALKDKGIDVTKAEKASRSLKQCIFFLITWPAIAGLICSYLPGWLAVVGFSVTAVLVEGLIGFFVYVAAQVCIKIGEKIEAEKAKAAEGGAQ